MSNNYRFAGLPLILVAATILLIALFHPIWLQQLQLYAGSNGEDLPLSAFWCLNWLFLPAIGSIFAVKSWTDGICRAIQIVAILLLPLILFLSYWLWEGLGWLLILAYAGGLSFLEAFDEETGAYTKKRYAVIACICVLYVVARITFYFINSKMLGYFDIALVALLSIAHIANAILAWIDWSNGASAIHNTIYLLIFAGLMFGATYINTPKLKDMPAIEAPTAVAAETETPQKEAKKQEKQESKRGKKEKATATPTVQPTSAATATPAAKPAQPAAEKPKAAANDTPAPAAKAQEPSATAAPKQEQPAAPVEKKAHPVEGYKTAAAAGDAAAMYNLAKCYQQGDGVTKNAKEAFRHMKAAAEAGYTKAYRELADMYRGGRGVAKSREQAELWYRKAAAAGDRKAQQALDNM